MASAAMFDLTGSVALVTGGNGGIGRGIARALAAAGASVAIFGRNVAKNQAVLGELQASGRPAMASVVDLADRAALAPAVAHVERTFGAVDVLVNNAGIVNLSFGCCRKIRWTGAGSSRRSSTPCSCCQSWSRKP